MDAASATVRLISVVVAVRASTTEAMVVGQGPGKVLNEAEKCQWAAAVAGVVAVGGGDVGGSGCP
jgi:hypothetical protein